jgi:hypothetical protein
MVMSLLLSPREQNQELSEEQEKMMKLWEKYATPGENHKHLEYFVGKWESIHKIWEKPGTGDNPIIRHQEINVKSILGGRYLKAHIKFKEKVMGKSAEGIVITGYDNFKEEFFAISFSGMATGYFVTSGTLDKSGKTRTETGIIHDYYITGKKIKVKGVTTIINRDKYVYQFYQPDSKGNEFKSMEIIYTRKTG